MSRTTRRERQWNLYSRESGWARRFTRRMERRLLSRLLARSGDVPARTRWTATSGWVRW